MTVDDWLEHVGEKVDIVMGEPVLSPDGFLTVSTSLGMNVLMVDKWRGLVTPVVPRTEWRGRVFQYRNSDCVRLYAEWSDATRGTALVQAVIKSMSRREYVERSQMSLMDSIPAFGFTQVDEPQYGDLLLVGGTNHVAVYLGNERILHHPEHKYSSIDVLDRSAILGVYRYGN